MGRKRAAEIIRDESRLLAAADRAGGRYLSGAARDVRKRLLQGEEPLPEWERASVRTREEDPGGGPEPGAKGAPIDRIAMWSRGAVVERLKADPSLRSNDKGRALLQLLTLQAAFSDVWDELIESVPAHCSPIVADLAGALLWSEFEARVGLNSRRPAETQPVPWS